MAIYSHSSLIKECINGKVGVLKMPTVEKTNGTNNRYCEDWLPVKNITNGMIQLENGYFVCGIKVEPKNILY